MKFTWKSSREHQIPFAATAIAALVSTSAYAQVDDGRLVLEEIIVTAQKREQTLQNTPLSVSAILGQDIIKDAKSSLADVLKDFNSIEVQGLAQGAQIYIRGVGSSIDPMFADPAVALMVDGVYNGRTEAVSAGAFDVARVEALRGPQGTLYGRNASGGVVNVITNNPTLDEITGFISGTIGNYDLRRAEGAINIPLGETVAVRFAGVTEDRDGYIDDGGNDSDFWGLRAKLLFEPNDNFNVIAKADVFDQGGTGQNTVPVPGSAGNLAFPPPFFIENFDPTMIPPFGPPGFPVFRFPDGWEQRDNGDAWSNNREHLPGFIERRSESYSAEINVGLDFATLTVLPSYTKIENRLVSNYLFGSIVPFAGPTYDISTYGDQLAEVEYTSLELRLSSESDGPWQYVAGLYWLESDQGDGELPVDTFTSSGDLLSLNNTFQPSETIAAFGQLTYSVTELFRLTAGLRLSRDDTAQDYEYLLTSPGGTASDSFAFDDSQDSSQYKLGLEYDLGENTLFYAHVATGFKQGGISPTFPPTSFDPEDLIAYEVGLKSQFWDYRAQVNVAAFRYDYDNYQFSVFETQPAGDLGASADFVVIKNADDTTLNGLELESRFALWEGGDLSLSLAYLDAEYGSAILPNSPFANQGDFDLGGRPIQNAPEFSGSLGISQTFEVFGGDLRFALNTHYSDGYYVSPEQYLPGAYQEDYTRTDFSIRFDSPDNSWYASAFLKNIEDDDQTTYVYPVYRRFVSDPRTYGLVLGYNF
ncbi:TonB-dependent receptor plug domain-containing protein [Parahaliea maris]|uniref:TonB-dependent receptor plug domain-containing protein n=1 Tax=Parahaliea maris TaxID=2716870 RepID=A0A5C8ZR59_9GAMM|nr:TonB-dependent receptor [Parahaliea maris]TXS90294.1 TonB-dependent receptor plug domain-containing protein [Parahaliea maris]